MKIEEIAKVCHEVNRAFCSSIGDESQPRWEDAPDWQKRSAILGVQFHLQNPDAKPSASHEEWMKVKLAEGWVWGPIKDENLKTHPCIVVYDELPQEQQSKDYLFKAVIHQLSSFLSI